MEFLRARLDEDEAWANDLEALAVWLAEKLLMKREVGYTAFMPLSEARKVWLETARSILEEIEDEPESWHASRFRVLREVKAKRKLIQELDRFTITEDAAHIVLVHLALPHNDHPDYDESWECTCSTGY